MLSNETDGVLAFNLKEGSSGKFSLHCQNELNYNDVPVTFLA